MDLKEFVAESIVQVCEGIKEAQVRAKEFGACVSPRIAPKGGVATTIDLAVGSISKMSFDVALEAVEEAKSNDTTKAGGGLKVLGCHLGLDGQNTEEKTGKTMTASRIQFEVNVFWPSVTFSDPESTAVLPRPTIR